MTVPDPFVARTEHLNDLIPKLIPKARSSARRGRTAVTTSFDVETSQENWIRRPLNGIVIKPNTNAYVQVVDVATGRPTYVFNEVGSLTRSNAAEVDTKKAAKRQPQHRYWTDWLLQSVHESRQEKFQIVETFGAPLFYSFGERPRLLNFQAVLLNTADYPWEAEFWENWDKFFRASKLIEHGNQMLIGFDDVVVTGYPINATAAKSVGSPYAVTVSFSLLITSYANVTVSNISVLQRAQQDNRRILGTTTKYGEEFLPTGTYDDGLFSSGFGKGSGNAAMLSNVIGGDRLKFFEHFKKLFGWSKIGADSIGMSPRDLLFSSSLRYIKGGKTATDFLHAYLGRQIMKYAYRGVAKVASKTPGGMTTLNFWFGLVGHLYRGLFLNSTQAFGVDLGEGSRWAQWTHNLAQMGNPYRAVVELAYAPLNLAATGLYSAAGVYEASNVEYDFKLGLVSKGQDGKYGRAINQKKSFSESVPFSLESTSFAATAEESSSKSATELGLASATTFPWGKVEGDTDPTVSVGGSALDVESKEEKADAADNEQAAVEEQKQTQSVKHGTLTVMEDDSEVEEDGTEELDA